MIPPGPFTVNRERLATILQEHHQKILDDWFAILRQKWTGQGERKLSNLKQKFDDQPDPFAFLMGNAEPPPINIDCATSQEYSVLDLFDATVSLEDAILNVLHEPQISGDERDQLGSMVREQILSQDEGTPP